MDFPSRELCMEVVRKNFSQSQAPPRVGLEAPKTFKVLGSPPCLLGGHLPRALRAGGLARGLPAGAAGDRQRRLERPGPAEALGDLRQAAGAAEPVRDRLGGHPAALWGPPGGQRASPHSGAALEGLGEADATHQAEGAMTVQRVLDDHMNSESIE